MSDWSEPLPQEGSLDDRKVMQALRADSLNAATSGTFAHRNFVVNLQKCPANRFNASSIQRFWQGNISNEKERT